MPSAKPTTHPTLSLDLAVRPDPWPVYVQNTDIDVDAQRVAAASGGSEGGEEAGGALSQILT